MGPGSPDPMDIFRQFFSGVGGGGFGGFDDEDTPMGGMGGGIPSGFSFRTSGMPGMGGMSGMPGMGGRGFGGRQKDPEIKREFEVSLEDLFKGKQKRFNVTKNITDDYGNTRQEQKILEVDVKPGYRDGTKITFHNEGDVRPGHDPADMVFIIKQKPHAIFTREKEHLIYKVPITLSQALRGVQIRIPHLDGTEKDVAIKDRIIDPNYVHRIVGAGMPKPKEPGQFGDLLLKFLISFPKSLTKEQKDLIKKAFEGVEYSS